MRVGVNTGAAWAVASIIPLAMVFALASIVTSAARFSVILASTVAIDIW